jgi:sodium/bile acid cotransporter 7
MISFLQKQWFLIGICLSVLLGYMFPGWGRLIKQYDLISIGIFLSFFCTGLCLESRSVLRLVTTLRAPIAAVVSSLALYPVIAWLLALQLLPTEFVIGICLIGAAPVTLSSGTIMTAIARGNVPLSILICILTNILAIFTMPLMLSLLLDVAGNVDLPIKQMIYGLFIVVLAPLMTGHLVRPFCMNIVRRYENPLSIFQSCIIILIIFNVVSNSAEQIDRAGSELVGVFLFVFFLYFFMLFVNYLIARLLRLDTSSMIAFTIHTSQKTLAVTYVVWSAHFVVDFPTAFLPAIMCQLVQMIAGTFVARFFRLRFESERIL